MAKYKAYPEYKNSGVEWLGKIPRNWKTTSISRLFSRIKRTGYTEKELLSVYRDYGVIPKSSRDDNNNKPSEDLSPYQLVEPNDLVMNKMKAWQGSIAISEYEGIVSPAYFVYQPNKILFDQAYPRYVHYLLRNPIYVTQYLSRSKGIRVNQWDLDPDEFRNIELLLPSKYEQEKIYNFLDYETAKIDNLIEKQQQLIELLKEKRQAVISHAVTKGLNPDVPMKNSGVEWLGEVPEHWIISRYKFCTLRVIVGIAEAATHAYSDIGTPIIRSTNIKEDGLSTSDLLYLKDEFARQNESKYLYGNDIVTVRTGYPGVSAVVPNELNNSHCFTNLISTPLHNQYAEYLSEYLNSAMGKEYFSLNGWGSAQKNISVPILQNFPIACPDKVEQEKISEFIVGKRREFSSLLKKAEESIRLMQERRTALISAAVTGKIDVRDWVAPDSSEMANIEGSQEVNA
ncbi:restriction endonuclease subunit S [Dickeya zeae]|uniref:Restriction endonuclease subunit S n=1 Tax=Dickeya zeae TaxID=204042 RepID=A0AAE6Z3B1_9GAMM|nr:restriction endonuclease subunit S [Dickeya zeae]QIZ52653.1 restriction endonuclease subunit S [Dickeya zeae]